jgi:hypothetical protein
MILIIELSSVSWTQFVTFPLSTDASSTRRPWWGLAPRSDKAGINAHGFLRMRLLMMDNTQHSGLDRKIANTSRDRPFLQDPYLPRLNHAPPCESIIANSPEKQKHAQVGFVTYQSAPHRWQQRLNLCLKSRCKSQWRSKIQAESAWPSYGTYE